MAGIVSEHEQQVQSKSDVSTEQPEQDQDIVKKINELLTRSKRHRKRYDCDWQYNYEFVVNGKQWPIDRPRWRFSESINIAWSTIMTEIAIQTDARPKFEFSAQEFGDQAFIDILQDLNNRNWEKYKWSSVVQDVLFDCKLYHVAHAIVEWNPELEYGLGDVEFRALDPFYCYWDPQASDVNKGKAARWFIYAEPVPTAMLKLKYPDFKEKIKPDVSGMKDRKEWGSASNVVYTNFDPYSPTRLPSAAGSSGEVFGGEPMTVLLRAWLRDDTLEELCEEKDEVDPETGAPKKEYVLKKKYPKGRYVEIANNLKLRDGAPGVEIEGEWVEYEDECFPVARLVNYSYAREYAGENEVTHIKGPNKVVNYIWSYILDMFRMQSNPITIVGADANLDEEMITNEPGSIYTVNDVNAIRREAGTSITPGSFDLLTTAQNLLDKVQGLQDVARGVEVPSIGSQVMLEGYLEASQTRPRMKNRNLDAFLQDAGELALKRVLQFYKQPRVFRVVNKEGWPSFIEFYIPEVVDENGKTKKIAKIRKVSTLPDGSQRTESMESEVKGIPDVRVHSGSALPYAKAQKSNTARQLYTDQAIDRKELLKAIDWPNYEEVLKRMEQAEAEAAQAEAGAQT